MPKCMVCESPAREVIDPALAKRDLDAVDPNLNGQTPSLEALCVQLQLAHGTPGVDYPFTLPQMITHAQNCPRYVKPKAMVPTSEGFLTEVTIKGKKVAVPSAELTRAYIMAAGVMTIISHPESVKPQHLLRIMELQGGKGLLEGLMKAVQDIIKHNPPDAVGPMKPPDG